MKWTLRGRVRKHTFTHSLKTLRWWSSRDPGQRGGIEAFLQLHPEPKLLSSSDLSEYEFSLQWDQWDGVIVF